MFEIVLFGLLPQQPVQTEHSWESTGQKMQFNLPKYHTVVCINPELQYWKEASPRFVAI